MNRCPHCQARVSFTRTFTYTRWPPYVCPRCGRRSRFADWQMGAVGGAAAAVLTVSRDAFAGSVLEYYAITATAMCALIQGAMATVVRLEPVSEDVDSAP